MAECARLYGSAHRTDPKYAVYAHIFCLSEEAMMKLITTKRYQALLAKRQAEWKNVQDKHPPANKQV